MMRVVIVYESTRGRTKAMADAICEGVKSAGGNCDLINAPGFKELGDACALAVGASTRMKRPLPKVRQILSDLQALNGKPVAAFGSYGWSGEAPEFIGQQLESIGGVLVDSPLRVKDYPDDTGLAACKELGKKLAENCK
ncbi:MAG: flavodoxin domain-containing protein [Candidatus Thorarchaeota archaeon]|jgi:flavorubredoxin